MLVHPFLPNFQLSLPCKNRFRKTFLAKFEHILKAASAPTSSQFAKLLHSENNSSLRLLTYLLTWQTYVSSQLDPTWLVKWSALWLWEWLSSELLLLEPSPTLTQAVNGLPDLAGGEVVAGDGDQMCPLDSSLLDFHFFFWSLCSSVSHTCSTLDTDTEAEVDGDGDMEEAVEVDMADLTADPSSKGRPIKSPHKSSPSCKCKSSCLFNKYVSLFQ